MNKAKPNSKCRNEDKLEQLKQLKKRLIEKIFTDISHKYHTLIQDWNYQLINFEKDFSPIIEQNFNFNDPNYQKLLHLTEEEFLNKFQPHSGREINNAPLNQETRKNDLDIGIDYDQPSSNEPKRKELVKKLKQREKEDWAVITKYNNEIYQEEEKKKLELKEQLKKQQLEDLNTQITQKEKRATQEKEIEDIFNSHLNQFTNANTKKEKTKLEQLNGIEQKKRNDFTNQNEMLIKLKNERKQKEKEQEDILKDQYTQKINDDNQILKRKELEKQLKKKEYFEYLKKQMEEKQNEVKCEKQNKIETETKEIEEKVKHIMEEKEHHTKKIELSQLRYRQELENQITSLANNPQSPELMTEDEKKLNKILLEKSREYLKKKGQK